MNEGRAEHHPGLGLRRVGEPGDAEVGDLQRVGFRVIHQVRRLDVAVNHALLVRVAERFRSARDDRDDLRRRQQAPRLRETHQIAALQELHRDIAKVVLFARVVDRHDVRMRKSPGGLGLAEEPLLHLGELVGLEFLRQRHRLDRDDAADLRIFPR
jgi:hypothetical protein